ncbi:MAG: nucleoside monophosphate kinase [Candidatus Pacebacteria bacterium]|nr:nucleoside monophosphate kinase [Candidatus Paceibacterota bacterium]
MSPKTVILMGRAGSGKGTQSVLLKEELKRLSGREVFYLEVGSKFRAFVEGTSYSSRKGKETILRGDLMPSFLAVWNWGSSLLDNLTGEEHLVADGTPRMLGEATMFMEAMQFYNRGPIFLLHLNVPEDEVSKRLTLRARHDDSPEGIANRLKAFEEETKPVLEFFKTAPGVNFIEIDGHQAIPEVHKTIMNALAPHLND